MIVLVAILYSGLLSSKYINASSNSMTDMIDNASTMVEKGRWDDAVNQIQKLENRWDSSEGVWGILVDHFEIDNIAMSMKKSRKYIEAKSLPESLAELDNLKFMVEHIYEKERFNLKNIF
jgi:hypothetical protein